MALHFFRPLKTQKSVYLILTLVILVILVINTELKGGQISAAPVGQLSVSLLSCWEEELLDLEVSIPTQCRYAVNTDQTHINLVLLSHPTNSQIK